MAGWVKLHRKFMDWQWYTDNSVKSVFIHLLLCANIDDKMWRNVQVNRGSLITSISHLSTGTKLSYQKVRTALKKLENTNEIIIKSTNKFTLITICKYCDYQSTENDVQQTNNKQITNKQQTNNKQITTTKEYKNKENKRIEEESNIPSASASGSLHQDMISIYDEFIQLQTGGPAKINGKEAKAVKDITAYLSRLIKNKKTEVTDTDITDAWRIVLGNFNRWDQFHQSNLNLSQINSNLVNIINRVKNGKASAGTGADKYRQRCEFWEHYGEGITG